MFQAPEVLVLTAAMTRSRHWQPKTDECNKNQQINHRVTDNKLLKWPAHRMPHADSGIRPEQPFRAGKNLVSLTYTKISKGDCFDKKINILRAK